MKYNVSVNAGRVMVQAKIDPGEAVDKKALAAFGHMGLQGFLLPRMAKRNMLAFSGTANETLTERLKRPITKREFFLIIEQVAFTVQKIWQNKLLLNRLMLDTRLCFINNATAQLQFIYVPTAQEMKNPGVRAFMENVAVSVVPAAESDMGYAARFLNFLGSQKYFDPKAVISYIAEEKQLVARPPVQSAAREEKQESAQKVVVSETEEASREKAVQEEVPVCAEPAAPEQEKKVASPVEEDDPERTILVQEDSATILLEDEGTVLIEEPVFIRCPVLHRVSNGEEITVNKSSFRLGKEKSRVDGCISDNNAVSRVHADIVKRGDAFFVVDLNSKNHVYINNQRIPEQTETPLQDGDVLKLGNEAFVFNL